MRKGFFTLAVLSVALCLPLIQLHAQEDAPEAADQDLESLEQGLQQISTEPPSRSSVARRRPGRLARGGS